MYFQIAKPVIQRYKGYKIRFKISPEELFRIAEDKLNIKKEDFDVRESTRMFLQELQWGLKNTYPGAIVIHELEEDKLTKVNLPPKIEKIFNDILLLGDWLVIKKNMYWDIKAEPLLGRNQDLTIGLLKKIILKYPTETILIAAEEGEKFPQAKGMPLNTDIYLYSHSTT